MKIRFMIASRGKKRFNMVLKKKKPCNYTKKYCIVFVI